MLYLNGELLSTTNRKEDYQYKEYVDFYNKTLKEIRDKFGNYLTIKTKHESYSDPETGALRFPATKGLLVKSIIPAPDGAGMNE